MARDDVALVEGHRDLVTNEAVLLEADVPGTRPFRIAVVTALVLAVTGAHG
ncbi:MAG: hypothetical protein ACE5I3_03155 [Phycisphaerae bacterium]